MRNYVQVLAAIALVLLSSCAGNPKEKKIVHYINAPTVGESSLPYLFSNTEKTMMSWVEKSGDSLVKLKYADLVDGEWKEPKEIINGKDWFVNWADFPMIAENNGHLFSHVLKKTSSGPFSYDVKLNVLPKGQSRWTTNLPLHNDSTATEHGFVTALPIKSDSFFVTWLDGRNTVSNGHEHGGAMNIRAAEVSPNGGVNAESLLDDRTCDCCQTTAAITSNGPVVLYRDRLEDETRDISIVRMVNGSWTEPKAIYNDNWKIKGCPVNGPKADALDNDLAVAWFTAADNQPKVNVTFSADGGENFDVPIQINEADAMGRVDVLLLDHENAIVSWMETLEDEAQIKTVKVHTSGKKSVPITICRLDSSRKTGFPQMELVGDKVYFAWTDLSDEITTVKMAYVQLNSF
jgi:hypothetical protein